MDKPKAELWKAAKFGVVGVANTAIDYFVFLLLAQVLGVPEYLSNVISYTCGMANSYVFNRSWTFKAQDRFFSPALIKFIVLNLTMLGLSTLLLWVFHGRMGLSNAWAKLFATGITMVVSFFVNRLWVFKAKGDPGQNS